MDIMAFMSMPWMPSKRHSVVLLLGFISACGGSSFKATGTPPHPVSPRASGTVLVLTGPPPLSQAVEIGRIEASTGVRGPGSEVALELLDRIRTVAGENGCDSILVGPAEESLAATSGGTPMHRTRQSAICFVNR